jgi:cell envelope opacity-associated protein A
MVPKTRPTLQRDLKDLSTAQSTAGEHHFVLGTFTAIALLAVYISINTPSASTADISELSKSTNISTKSIFPDFELHITSSPAGISGFRSESEESPAENATLHSPEQPNAVAVIAEQLIGQSDQATEPALNTILDTELQPDAAPVEQQSAQPVAGSIQELGDELDSTPDPAAQLENPETKLTRYLQSQPWISSKVKKGDSLSKILNRNDIGARHAYEITQFEDARSLLKIRPGQTIDIKKNANGEFAQLQYKLDKFNMLSVLAVENNYIVEIHTQEPEIRLNNAKATIYQNPDGRSTSPWIFMRGTSFQSSTKNFTWITKR